MPSKRMVPEQEVSELSDEVTRLHGVVGEIAALTEQRDRAMAVVEAARPIIAAWDGMADDSTLWDEHIDEMIAVLRDALDTEAAADSALTRTETSLPCPLPSPSKQEPS